MGVFDPASLKDLKKQAEVIGGMCGQAHVGDLSWADVEDVIRNDGFRERLQAAFSSAAQDVGETKALKAAMRSARYSAEAVPFVRKVSTGDVETRAESAISQMLRRG